MNILYKTGDPLHSSDELILMEIGVTGPSELDGPLQKTIMRTWPRIIDDYNYESARGLQCGDVIYSRIDNNKMVAMIVTHLEMLMPQDLEHTTYFVKETLRTIQRELHPETLAITKFATDLPWEEVEALLLQELPTTNITCFVY